jgi:hypothetical protein
MPAPIVSARLPQAPALFRLGLAVLVALQAGLAAPLSAQVTPAPAEEAQPLPAAQLTEALQLDALFAILVEEGLAQGAELEAESFPAGGGPGWDRALADLYDQARLQDRFATALAAELADDPALPEILAFFGSDLGARAITAEIAARRAFLDPAAEDAARVAADRLRGTRDPRLAQIERFIAAGDLLEANVAGALSGNLAFLTGLSDAGVYGAGRPEDELLADVWGQEPTIRDETQSWLNAYLVLAYAGLSEEELDRYTEFWESAAGQRLNAALFLAFDTVFRPLSYELGRAAGIAMLGRDI